MAKEGTLMNTGRKQPCRECEDRHFLCWNSCQKYQEFRAERDCINNQRMLDKEQQPRVEKYSVGYYSAREMEARRTGSGRKLK